MMAMPLEGPKSDYASRIEACPLFQFRNESSVEGLHLVLRYSGTAKSVDFAKDIIGKSMFKAATA